MPNATLSAEDLGTCPSCGRKLSVDIESCAVIHELPICAVFVEKDALEFLIWVRQQKTAAWCAEKEGN